VIIEGAGALRNEAIEAPNLRDLASPHYLTLVS
jgi:hypothetical protein